MKQRAQTPWKIRRATRSDLNAILSFLEAQHRPKRSDFVVSEYFIAESLEKIIGCVAARDKEGFGYLYGLAVERSWRRRGIGHSLTQHGLDWLSDKGAESVFTLVMFWNIRFVKKHGFELADRRKKRDLGSLHDDFVDRWSARSVLMIKDLRQPLPQSFGLSS